MARVAVASTAATAATLLLAVSTALLVSTASAYAKYALKLPNGDAVPGAPAVGHVDAAGLQGVNSFGKDWSKFGKGWTVAYCQADSDGDGFTNGQELGDPCCTWTPTSTAGLITDGISHPSDSTKTPTNPALQTACSSTSSGSANGTAGGATAADASPGTVHAGGGTSTLLDHDDGEDEWSETLKPLSSARQCSRAAALLVVCGAAVALWL